MPKNKKDAQRGAAETNALLRATGIPKTYKNHWSEQKVRRCLGGMSLANNLMTITVVPYTKFGIATDRNVVECVIEIPTLCIEKRTLTNKIETPETKEPMERFIGSLTQAIVAAVYKQGDMNRTNAVRAAIGLQPQSMN